jgi:hypothetical protein
MASPSNTTITVDGVKLNAFSTQVGISSAVDSYGAMPSMATLSCALDFSADMHDTTNVPFATVKKYFDLANVPTNDKIKDIKIEFWKDENKKDPICTLKFKGWISSWNVSSGGGSNHVLSVSIQPALDQQNHYHLQLEN